MNDGTSPTRLQPVRVGFANGEAPTLVTAPEELDRVLDELDRRARNDEPRIVLMDTDDRTRPASPRLWSWVEGLSVAGWRSHPDGCLTLLR